MRRIPVKASDSVLLFFLHGYLSSPYLQGRFLLPAVAYIRRLAIYNPIKIRPFYRSVLLSLEASRQLRRNFGGCGMRLPFHLRIFR